MQTEQLANTMLQQVYALLARHNIIPNAVQEQMLTSHVRAMAHRSVTGEPLPEVEAELFDEISPDSMQLAREVVAQFGNLPDEEAGCSPFTSKSRKTTFKEQHMEQITVVIGDRTGKGQKVAAGVEKAGGRAVVVPGMAADMKLGDVMKAETPPSGSPSAAAAARAPSPLRPNMATRPNTACAPWMRGDRHQRRLQRAGLWLYG